MAAFAGGLLVEANARLTQHALKSVTGSLQGVEVGRCTEEEARKTLHGPVMSWRKGTPVGVYS